MKTTIYMVVFNSGDGSAYVNFYSDKKLAEWFEDQQIEGFAESSLSELTIEHEGSINIDKLVTPFSAYIDMLDSYSSEPKLDEFTELFLPTGLPEFELKLTSSIRNYNYFDVIVDGQCVSKLFVSNKKDMESLRRKILRQ